MKEHPSTPKRLILNIETQLHQQLKIASTRRNMSMTDYVTQVLVWRLAQEELDNTEEEFVCSG